MMRVRFAPYLAAASLGLALGLAPIIALSPVGTLKAAAAQASQRNLTAEQFVQTQADRALRILRDGSNAEKIKDFRGFIDQVADVPTITHFVLGKYNRSISNDQFQRFASVFREYASNVYQTRLADYHGETLTVTGSVTRRPGDVIVSSLVAGGAQAKPSLVRWRVIEGPAGWRLDDVEADGVWLAITEQQDFVSTIDNAHGDINVLIDQLQKRNQQTHAVSRSD